MSTLIITTTAQGSSRSTTERFATSPNPLSDNDSSQAPSPSSSSSSTTAKTPTTQLLNARVLIFTILASFGASYFGYTSAIVSSLIVLPSFAHTFSLPPPSTTAHDTITSNIVSVIYIGTLLGTLFSPSLTTRLGPRKALAIASTVYLLGCILQTFSSGYLALMYIGRVIAGIGMGSSTTLSPLYISEISSPESRGLLVGIHEVSFQISAVIGFWMGFIVEKFLIGRVQYMVLVGGQLIPGIILLVAAVVILPESPRFLVSIGRNEKARDVLGYLRYLPITDENITSELEEIITCHQVSVPSKESPPSTSTMDKLRTNGYYLLFKSKQMRNRVFLGCIMMFFLNLTGAVALNSYLPSILKQLGIQGRSKALLLTGVFSLVKCFTVTISSIWFVDRYGRKVLLVISAVGISAVMWYLGSFITITDRTRSLAENSVEGGHHVGAAGYFALSCIYIFGIFFCLASQVPWIYCAEIFPNRHRSSGVSITTTAQFVAEYLVTKSSPYMLTSIKGGTFFFFAACTSVMVIWVLLCVPETKGRSLESMEAVFTTTELARKEDVEGRVMGIEDKEKEKEKIVVVEMVEEVRE
ncbi:general substrate transporter [Peziza echinospora]|nr:general substrate transporter [Peziza echinospora]